MNSCDFDKCTGTARTRGLCPAHYAQLLKGQELRPLRPRITIVAPCKGPECNRPSTHTGLCTAHNWQQSHGKELAPIRKREHKECPVVGCDRISSFASLCHRHSRYALVFNLSEEDFVALLARGKCDICGKTGEHRKGELVIDHDHVCCPEPSRSCGKCVRGLVCSGCNWALGQAGDSPERLRAMADYIEAARK